MTMLPPPLSKGELKQFFDECDAYVDRLRRDAAVESMRPGSVTYVPQEYPKMVPGPNGPTTVSDAAEEYRVLTQRVMSMGMTLTGPPDGCPKTGEHEKAESVFGNKSPIEPLNVELWLRDRRAQDHDWIGALYRPYEPPV